MSKLILIAFLIWALILLCGNYADVNTITLSPDDEEMPDWGRFKADFRHDRLVYLEPGNYFAHEGSTRQKRYTAFEAAQCMNDSEVVNTILKRHNKRKVPLVNGRDPVNITFELWVQEISRIKEISSEFELDVYVTETWTDPSLEFDMLNPCRGNISLDAGSMLKKMWYPNGIFISSKSASVHKSPIENVYLMIYKEGGVWFNYRIKLTGPCKKNFKQFPLDYMHCLLAYESNNYNADSVRFIWKPESPLYIMKEIRLPDYDLVNTSLHKLIKNYPPGKWDQLAVVFLFNRKYGFYILQAYVPAYITVFMSWVSFYLGTGAIPARTMVGVNALLALTFQFGNIISNLPRSSEVKAIDVWLLTCMAFIFCSLFEMALVGFLVRNQQKKAAIKCKCAFYCIKCPLWTPYKIDTFSMMVFPLMFAGFNLFYWGWYVRRTEVYDSFMSGS